MHNFAALTPFFPNRAASVPYELLGLLVLIFLCSSSAATAQTPHKADTNTALTGSAGSGTTRPESIVLKYIELARLGRHEELAELVHLETSKKSKSYQKGADAPSEDVLIKMNQRLLLVRIPKMIVAGELTSIETSVLQESRRNVTIRSRLKSKFESDSTMTATFELKDIGRGSWKIVRIELTPAAS